MTSGGAGGIVIQMWRIVPGPSMSASTTDSPARDPHVGRALATAVRGAARAPRAGRVLEGDRAAVERRVDEGRVLEVHRVIVRASQALRPSSSHGRSATTSAATGASWNSFAYARRGRSVVFGPA